MHRVCITSDIVWLHHMFYQKTYSVGESNTDHTSVGNWSNKMQGVFTFRVVVTVIIIVIHWIVIPLFHSSPGTVIQGHSSASEPDGEPVQ